MKTPSIEYIDFRKSLEGLVPVIIQDVDTLKVLMLGYMNEETYQITIKSKKVIFYSRFKKRDWIKGEESYHYLDIKEIFIDCDRDTILIKVKSFGSTCHQGTDSCMGDMSEEYYKIFQIIEKIIFQRKKLEVGIQESYIKYLLKISLNKIIKKVGEETVELLIESKANNKVRFVNEAADLLFHYIVLLHSKNINIKDILLILKKKKK